MINKSIYEKFTSFDLIKTNQKMEIKRPVNEFWNKIFYKMKSGDTLTIHRGYSLNRIIRVIKSIYIIKATDTLFKSSSNMSEMGYDYFVVELEKPLSDIITNSKGSIMHKDGINITNEYSNDDIWTKLMNKEISIMDKFGHQIFIGENNSFICTEVSSATYDVLKTYKGYNEAKFMIIHKKQASGIKNIEIGRKYQTGSGLCAYVFAKTKSSFKYCITGVSIVLSCNKNGISKNGNLWDLVGEWNEMDSKRL